jgi:hypothetical protein
MMSARRRALAGLSHPGNRQEIAKGEYFCA